MKHKVKIVPLVINAAKYGKLTCVFLSRIKCPSTLPNSIPTGLCVHVCLRTSALQMMEGKSEKQNGPDEGELVGYCCSVTGVQLQRRKLNFHVTK